MRATLCSLLFLVLIVSPTHARPRIIHDPIGDPPDRAGSTNDLPVGCRYTPQQIEDWARTKLPAVQSAMREFEARGYVRAAEGDTALNGCVDAHVPCSVAILIYKKPGAFIDSTSLVWPQIIATTRVHPSSGEAVTTVSAGLVVVDGAADQVTTGDQLFPAERSFDIQTTRSRGVLPEGQWNDKDSELSRWARCTGWGTTGCVWVAIRWGGPAYAGLKLAALLEMPAVGLGLLAFCFTANAISCFGSL